jgi:CO/xanthine dehydrogenase Mo-binding subunit
MPNYRYIGKHSERLDAERIMTGEAVFLDDFKLPNMLIGKALRSPYPRALIKRIDTSKAKSLKGVRAVLTYEDSPENWFMGGPACKPFMGRELNFVGDIVALVAADNTAAALAALDLIDVEYEVRKPVMDVEDAVREGAPQLYEAYPNNTVPPGLPFFQPDKPHWQVIKGDVQKGFEACKYVAEETVSFDKMATPMAPEPPGAIAEYVGHKSGFLEFNLWSTTQSTTIQKLMCEGRLLGTRWNVRSFNVGGSYGNKQTQILTVTSAAVLSLRTRRPVKFFLTKHEQMIAHETRLGSRLKGRIGLTEDGTVHAVEGLWMVDTGAISDGVQGQIGVGLGEAQMLMCKCPNWNLDSMDIVTNKCPAGIVRGYGGQELNSSIAPIYFKAMKAGNFDPLTVLKKNYVSKGDHYIWRDGRNWISMGPETYPETMQKAGDKFGWDKLWKGWNIPTRIEGSIATGVGVGVIGNADVGEDNTEAIVRFLPNLVGASFSRVGEAWKGNPGTGGAENPEIYGMFSTHSEIVIECDITESGMGTRSNACKIAAEILNVPIEKVTVTPPHSTNNPRNFGLCGSRGTIATGHAISEATKDLKEKILQLSADFLDAPKEQLEIADFMTYCRDEPSRRVFWTRLGPKDLSVTGYGRHVEIFNTPTMCMVFVEVKVDLDTGRTWFVRMVTGTDVGQIIDSKDIQLQLQGGIGSASGDTAIFEEGILDPATGRNLANNMIEYKWRTFNEFPDFDSVVDESQIDSFMFKAVGIGEVSGASVAGAIMMAISNAIGADVKDYPATPDVILRAMGKIK